MKGPNPFSNATFETGFYKIPQVTNIREKPTYPYQMNVGGMIHANQLQQLYEIINAGNGEYSREVKMNKIEQLFSTHELGKTFPYLQVDEIADFLRHVIIINKDKLGWDIADYFLKELSCNYLPRWEYQGNKVDNLFRPVLTQFVSWQPNDEQLSLVRHLEEVIRSSDLQLIEEHVGLRFDQLYDRRLININTLSRLYELSNLMVYRYKKIEESKIQPLITRIEVLFRQQIMQSSQDRKIPLSLIFAHGLLSKQINDFKVARSMIRDLWESLGKENKKEYEEYRWVFGSFFTLIASKLIESESDVLSRKMIIDNLLANYIKPGEIDLDHWRSHLLSNNLHPWVFTYIIEGYAEMLHLLEEYALDIPIEADRMVIFQFHNDLSLFLCKISTGYLRQLSPGIEYFNDHDPVILKVINQVGLPVSLQKSFLDALLNALKTSLTSRLIEDDELARDMENLAYKIIENFFSDRLRDLFQLDMQLNFSIEYYENLFAKMRKEYNEHGSIIPSKTFEREIIGKYAQLFQDIVNHSGNRYSYYDRYGMEVLLWFLSYWYLKFQKEEIAEIESKMILSPFISMLYKNLAIYYYENKQNTKAHIMLLNGYLFNLMEGETLASRNTETNRVGEILEKFTRVYNQIDFRRVPKRTNVREFVISAVKNVVKGSKTSHEFSSAFSEEIIFSYLDKRDELDEFLGSIDGSTDNEIMQILRSSSLFTPPESSPIIFDKIGMHFDFDFLKKYPMPMIRNINAYSIAISLFPLGVMLPSFMIEMDF